MKAAALILTFLFAAPAIAQEPASPAPPAAPENLASDGLAGLEVRYDEFDDETTISAEASCDTGRSLSILTLSVSASFPGRRTAGTARAALALVATADRQLGRGYPLRVIAADRYDLSAAAMETMDSRPSGVRQSPIIYSHIGIWWPPLAALRDIGRGQAFRGKWGTLEFRCDERISRDIGKLMDRMKKLEQPGSGLPDTKKQRGAPL